MKLILAAVLALFASTVVVFATSGNDRSAASQTTATNTGSADASAPDSASISVRREAPNPAENTAPAPAEDTPAEPAASANATPATEAAAKQADTTPPAAPAETAPAEPAPSEPAPSEPEQAKAASILAADEPEFAESGTESATDSASENDASVETKPAQVTAALTNPDDTIGSFVTAPENTAENTTANTSAAANNASQRDASQGADNQTPAPANTQDEPSGSAEDVAAMFSGETEATDEADSSATDADIPDTESADTETAETTAETETVGAYTIEDDNTLVIEGGRWTIEGSGTEADPYVVPWNLLDSAQDSYEPRLGKETVPAWAEYLDGKTVAIAGYLLMPMGGGTAKDLLAMRNQWDGCGLGTPPTPYTAIEVTLTQAVDTYSSPTSVSYGTVEGTFRVDPYITSGWLLGLYILENAAIKDARPAYVP